jgi:hypothetical protein
VALWTATHPLMSVQSLSRGRSRKCPGFVLTQSPYQEELAQFVAAGIGIVFAVVSELLAGDGDNSLKWIARAKCAQ